jgi:hypothetical protein
VLRERFVYDGIVDHSACFFIHGENVVPSARNQAATTGPVLSSTRKRTYALSATSGMKVVFSKVRAANSKHA